MNRPSTPCFATMPGDDDDEGAGRPGDLHARAAERRHDEAGDDRAVDAGLRRQAGGDGKRHGERQGHQADGDAGGDVGDGGAAVVRAQAGDEARRRSVPLSITISQYI